MIIEVLSGHKNIQAEKTKARSLDETLVVSWDREFWEVCMTSAGEGIGDAVGMKLNNRGE